MENEELINKLIEQAKELSEANTKSVIFQQEILSLIKTEIAAVLGGLSENQNLILTELEEINKFVEQHKASVKCSEQIALKLEAFVKGEIDATRAVVDMKMLVDDKRYKVKDLAENLNLLLVGEDYQVMKLVKKLNFFLDAKTLVIGLILTVAGLVGAYQLFFN